MSRGIQRFRSSDLSKAIKGAQECGLDVDRFEIDRAGKIVIIASKAAAAQSDLVAELDQEFSG